MIDKRIKALAIAICLQVSVLCTNVSLAQHIPYLDASRLTGATSAAGSPSIEVSKTAFVNGQNVCGIIRIKNAGRQSATVSAIADSLEVHFPSFVSQPTGLAAGSTPGWFNVADVPISLPGPIAPGKTATIDYCFSLCVAADSPGANSMRNVVNVSVGSKSVTTRSVSFAPPVLDCRACCMPNGSCTNTVPADCTAHGGLSQAIGSDCSTTECTQACCLPSGICDDLSVSDCRGEGGEPLGLGTTCATANMTCRGACCAASYGGCVDDFSVESCRNIAGTYLGPDTTCAAASTSACPTGACCLEGVCKDTILEGVSISRFGCEEAFGRRGSYLGDGTTCATANTTCRGACCAASYGGCVDDFSVESCRNIAGTYLGPDTTCAAASTSTCPTGACCLEGTCHDASTDGASISQFGCEEAFSRHGAYLGDGTTCATANTTCHGACCADTVLGCIDERSVEGCRNVLGTYLGNDTTCAAASTSTCPTGACCVEGTCRDPSTDGVSISQTGCEGEDFSLHGAYLGDGTTCATSECCISPGNTGCTDPSECCDYFGVITFSCEVGRCCNANGGSCAANEHCCNANATCELSSNTCYIMPGDSGCSNNSDCYPSVGCIGGKCCSPLRGFCVTADYCCNGNGICGNDHLCCLPAFRSGCTSDSDCCSGLVCDSGSCMGVTSP